MYVYRYINMPSRQQLRHPGHLLLRRMVRQVAQSAAFAPKIRGGKDREQDDLRASHGPSPHWHQCSKHPLHPLAENEHIQRIQLIYKEMLLFSYGRQQMATPTSHGPQFVVVTLEKKEKHQHRVPVSLNFSAARIEHIHEHILLRLQLHQSMHRKEARNTRHTFKPMPFSAMDVKPFARRSTCFINARCQRLVEQRNPFKPRSLHE